MNVAIGFPAEMLEGCVLESGWTIGKRIFKAKGASGGNFGVCYNASRQGAQGFVKALDFKRALMSENRMAKIAELAQHFQWEKEVMEYCEARKLSKIVKLVNHESFNLPGEEGDISRRVDCLVMEVGEGDLRKVFDISVNASVSWKLFVARDVALALDQLHRNGIAHLDVKPSNVIAMPAENAHEPVMKLGDLGRVVRKGIVGPFDQIGWPGDPKYQPPEKIYGYKSSQWNDEREAADAFMLGSLMVFLFTGTDMTTLMLNETPEQYRLPLYRGDFDRALIDVLVLAQARALSFYVMPELGSIASDEISALILELTDPNPATRGDKNARRGGMVGIDRYHQKLLRLALRHKRVETRS